MWRAQGAATTQDALNARAFERAQNDAGPAKEPRRRAGADESYNIRGGDAEASTTRPIGGAAEAQNSE